MDVRKANIGSDTEISSYYLWILFGMLIFALIYRLGYLELNGEEPRRAVVAWEMLKSGNYLVPHVYGMEYYNKPPLYNWILAGFIALFGTSEFVVRLPGILSFLSIGLVLYYWLRSRWGSQQAVLTSFIFWTSADLVLYATVYPAELDLTFTLFMVIQAIGIYRIGKNPNDWSGFVISYIALIAAIFTKGWIAVPFHLFALIAWSSAQGQFRKLFNLKHAVSLLGFIVVFVCYYWLFNKQGNLTLLLLNNFIESSSKVNEVSFSSIVNQLTECPLSIIKISLPWTLLLYALGRRSVRAFIRSNDTLFFSAIYILSNIWIYWIFIDVRDRYMYPFIPFLCVIISGIIFQSTWWPKKRRLLIGLMAVMISLRILYGIFILPRMLNGQLSNDNIYRALVDTLLIKTNGKPIDILVPVAPHELPFTYHGISSIDRPPVIPYQIPFYIIRQIQHAPTHETVPIAGQYYLALTDQIEFIDRGKVLYRFEEAWYGKEVVLIQIEKNN